MVALRGPDPSETLVSLDGQVLNDSNTGDFDLSQFPSAPLASIDAAEGLGPAENRAANTIGGQIDLRTLQPTLERHRDLSASLGSFGSTSLGAEATGRAGRLGYALAGQTRNVSGYVVDLPALVAAAPVFLGARTSVQSALANVTYDVSARSNVRLRYFTLANRRDESAARDAPADLTQDRSGGTFTGPGNAYVTQGLRALLLSGRVPLGAGSFVASYALSGATGSYAGGATASPYDLAKNDRLDTLTVGWERSTPAFEIGIGGYTRGESLDESGGFFGDVQRQRSHALDARVAWQTLPRLRVAFDVFDTHYSTFGSSLDGRAGLALDLDARSVLRASVGTGFRAPLLAERFALSTSDLSAAGAGALDVNCVAANGNPDERAEHVTAYELGYARRLGARTTLDLSTYRTNLREPIEIAYPLSAHCPAAGAPTLQGIALPVNVGRAVYALRVVFIARTLTVRAAYGLNAARPLSLPSSVSNPTSGATLVPGQQFFGIPLQTGSFAARYAGGAFHADAALTWKGRNNELHDGPFATLGGAVGERIGALDVAVTFRNLTSAEAGRFTRLGLGSPYPSPFAPNGSLPTDRFALEPAAFGLTLTFHG